VAVGRVGRVPVAGGVLPIVRAKGAVLLTCKNGSHMSNELAVFVHVAPGLFVRRGRHSALLDPASLVSANRRRLIEVESPHYLAAPSHSRFQSATIIDLGESTKPAPGMKGPGMQWCATDHAMLSVAHDDECRSFVYAGWSLGFDVLAWAVGVRVFGHEYTVVILDQLGSLN